MSSKRHAIFIASKGASVIPKIGDHLEMARGKRPSKAAIVTEALTRMWRELYRSDLTQEELARDKEDYENGGGQS